MAFNRTLQFTDEEILAELKKLGYDEISLEMFNLLKKDLALTILQEEARSWASLSFSPDTSGSSSELRRSSSAVHPPTGGLYKSYMAGEEQTAVKQVYSPTTPLTQIRNTERKLQDKSSSSSSGKENKLSSSSASSVEDGMIKRKVLRHKNGKAVITEELRPIPSFSSSSSSNQSSTSLSRSKSSLSASSYRPMSSRSRSTSSGDLSSSQSASTSSSSSSSSGRSSSRSRGSSVLLPNTNVKAKKCDPVRRYHQYKKYWDMFKPPGERTHKSLRWTIRERMLDYDFA